MKNNLYTLVNIIRQTVFFAAFALIAVSSAAAQCPADNRLITMPASEGKYYLPGNYTFKIKFDAPISTDTFKTGNIVQFSVVENVYGVKLPEQLKDETEIRNFREKLDKIIDSYKTGADIILEQHQFQLNEIRNSDQTAGRKDKETQEAEDQRKANELEDLNAKTAKQLENLYAVKTKSIEYLFFFGVHSPEAKVSEDKFNSELSKLEAEFKSNIKKLRDDPTKKEQVKELIRETFNKFQQLLALEKIELEKSKEDKTKRLEELKEGIEEKFKTNISKIEDKYNSDIRAVSDTDPIKKEKLEKLEDKRVEQLEKLEKDKLEEIKNLTKMPEVVAVIPKAAKGFGKVERSKRQLPLFINYKARISVVLDYVLLDNGDCVPIEIAVSPDNRLYNEGDPDIGNVIECKSGGLSKRKCIKGRRPQYNFVSPIISGLAAVATVLLDDPTAQALAGVTAVDQLTKGDLGNVLNGADATISDKLIYEVATRNSSVGTFKKEEKK